MIEDVGYLDALDRIDYYPWTVDAIRLAQSQQIGFQCGARAESVSPVSAVASAAAWKIQSVSYRRSQLQPSDQSSASGQNYHHLSRYRRLPGHSYAVEWAAFRDPSSDSEPASEGFSPRRDGHVCQPGDT